MKKTSALFLSLVCLLVFSLSGCSSTASFTLAVEAFPPSLDPQLAQTGAEQTAAVNLFEGLYRRRTDGTPVLAAAEKVRLDASSTVYTFTLRENLFWQPYRQNGQTLQQEVTAQDFVFAFQRIFTKQTRSPWVSTFSGILHGPGVLEGSLPLSALGVQALDAKTLVITLSAPDPSFPERLCAAGAMPCNQAFFQQTEGSYGLTPSQLLANGPFAITLWRPGELLVLRRRTPESGLVTTLRLEAPTPQEAKSLLQRYQEGKSDGVLTNAPSESSAFQFETTTWVLLLQTKNELLALPDIRAALAASCYASPLPLPAGRGFTPATGLLPPSLLPASQSRLPITEASPAVLFRQGLSDFHTQKEEGNTTPSLTILVPENTPLLETIQQINQRWQKDLALYCSIEQAPMEQVLQRVANREYTLALLPLNAPSGDGLAMLSMLDASQNQTLLSWQSDALSARLSSAQLESNPTARQAAVVEGEQLLLLAWPLLPITFETTTFITRQPSGGLAVSPFGPVLDFSAPAPQ